MGLGFNRLRIMLKQFPDNHMKTIVMHAFSLKIKEFLQNSLRQLEYQFTKKKAMQNDAMILRRFKDSFLMDVNTQFYGVDEKKKVFDVLIGLYPPLSSFLMENIVMTHTKELRGRNLLSAYISLIENPDIRSEVMDTIGMKSVNFTSKNAWRRFLLAIPNLDIAVVSTEKFARNTENFNSFSQRLAFVSALTDNDEKIRLFKRMLKEHSNHAHILNQRIQATKKIDNEMRKTEGLPPKHTLKKC